ncbi:MAG TPA: hypothetical protein VF116_20880 [Ktedonobacterales bacterium]
MEIELEASHVEQTGGATEFDQKVEIAVWALLATGKGAEDARMDYTTPPEDRDNLALDV